MTLSQVNFPLLLSLVPSLTRIRFHVRSVAMSVGSPALAAYSLVLSALNGRSIYRRARRINHETKTAVAKALISLQQTPLELTKDQHLLASIQINDKWRREIAERLDRKNSWSIATGFSVAWVVIAFVFTLVDSFVSLDNSVNSLSEGHAVGTLWLWLLCLVIGWLWVPTFSYGELKSAIGRANKAAKIAKKLGKKAGRKIKKGITKGIPPTLRRKRLAADPAPETPEEDVKVNEELVDDVKVDEDQIEEDAKPLEQGSKLEVNPLSNPAHHQSTVSFKLPPESQHDHGHHHVSANATANHSATSLSHSAAVHSTGGHSSVVHETDRLLIPKDEENWLNRDEFRLSATFNYSRIMRYLVLVDDVLRALNRLTRETEVGLSRKRLMLEVVSLIRGRRGLFLKPQPPPPLTPKGMLCSLRERAVRCSWRRSPPLFYSAERPPQPRSSSFSPPRSA